MSNDAVVLGLAVFAVSFGIALAAIFFHHKVRP